nr:hypothetical protein [Metabacillus crassostreae]
MRYKNALDILENNKNIEGINIIGGVRSHMDTYNDYQNLLLGEMHRAEKLNENFYKGSCSKIRYYVH